MLVRDASRLPLAAKSLRISALLDGGIFLKLAALHEPALLRGLLERRMEVFESLFLLVLLNHLNFGHDQLWCAPTSLFIELEALTLARSCSFAEFEAGPGVANPALSRLVVLRSVNVTHGEKQRGQVDADPQGAEEKHPIALHGVN